MTGKDEHKHLENSISAVDEKVDKFKLEVRQGFREVMAKLQPVHDFMIDQQGFFRGQQSVVKDKDLSAIKELVKTISILAGVIVLLAGIYEVTK